MDKLLLSSIDMDDLLTSFRAIVKDELKQHQQKELQERFLSPAEVCAMFQPKISKPTLTAWTKEGKLTEHRIGSRVFYKYSEIMDAMTRLKKYKRS